jgi:hypothetical protein
MQHLVISVSPDSSLKLLGEFADIVALDKESPIDITKHYDTLYIRSHFSQPGLQPQNFRHEIISIIDSVRRINPDIAFIDGMDTVDDIVTFEDKWHQYHTFREFMPKTHLYESGRDTSVFKRPLFKKRLSSRGGGISWSDRNITGSLDDWIIQESLDVDEEIRIYVVRGEVYPIAAVRQSMTLHQKTHAIDSRKLTSHEFEFALGVASKIPSLDMVGLDIALTKDGQLYLIEANRSPGFATFADLTNENLADILYP